MTDQQINLFDYDRQSLRALFEEMGERAFRADQIIKWLHGRGVTDIDQMTDLSKSLRSKLKEISVIKLPEVVQSQHSLDGTRKWLLKLEDGNCIETVFIPTKTHGTVCVSSQVGCALNCSFCSTGKQGYNRNLSTGEIIAQLWFAHHSLKEETGLDHPVTNVVMMGMGEPLLNMDNVLPAMNLMLDDFAFNLSKYRVTLSTSGVLPKMRELAEKSDVSLAVSLHAPNDELRNILVPINKKYPISQLMDVCRAYFKDEPKRSITFEYVMLDGVNDKPEHARQLIEILQGIPSKINLIPFNPFPHAPYKRSTEVSISKFQRQLMKAGFNTIVRRTRGEDIDAACGQLAGQVKDRTQRSAKWKAKHNVVIPIVKETETSNV